MRKNRPLSPALSAALLALAVTVCTGSLTEGAAAHELIRQGQARGVVDQRREGVTTFLSCLSEVAKSLYHPQHRQVSVSGLIDHAASHLPIRPAVFSKILFDPAKATPACPLRPGLLNLPPPALG